MMRGNNIIDALKKRGWFRSLDKPDSIWNPVFARRNFLGLGLLLVAGNPFNQLLLKRLGDQDHLEDIPFVPETGDSLSFELPERKNGARLPLDSTERLFLTFDDGPNNCTGSILDALAQDCQKATFFVLGRNLKIPKLRKFAVRAVKEGHELANHSYSHPAFSEISASRARSEIVNTHKEIQEVIAEAGVSNNHQNLFFRFPYGDGGSGDSYSASRAVLNELGYLIAWWDVDTFDWRMGRNARGGRAKKVMAAIDHAQPKDVVLMHDRGATATILPSVLWLLRAKRMASSALSAYPGLSHRLCTGQDIGPPISTYMTSKNLDVSSKSERMKTEQNTTTQHLDMFDYSLWW